MPFVCKDILFVCNDMLSGISFITSILLLTFKFLCILQDSFSFFISIMLCLKPSITKCWNNDSFGTRAVSVSIGTSNGMSNEMSNCPEKSQWSFEDLQPKTRYSI